MTKIVQKAYRMGAMMRWFKGVSGAVVALGFLLGGAACLPAQGPGTESIQYQFKNGKGLANISVEDALIGVGMILGERTPRDAGGGTPFTGSLSFERLSSAGQTPLIVEKIRFVEQVSEGNGRVFEPHRVYDSEMEKGKEPWIRFPEGREKIPFIWCGKKLTFVYFVFPEIPADIKSGNLVLTYTANLPGKRHASFFENRFPMKRKAYLRH